MYIVTCTIPDTVIEDLTGKTPAEVSIRLLLNQKGFKFEDDNRIELVLNANPIPLGKTEKYYDPAKMETFYKQTINLQGKL